MSPDPHISPPLRVWVDPACPWAWQAARWLIDLRDRGIVDIAWNLFSLELNSSDPALGFWEASVLHGEAHAALMLARREGGGRRFEALFVALARRLHERMEAVDPATFRAAAEDAGMADVIERARSDPRAPEDVRSEYQAARMDDVFGVPTLSLDGSKAMYGPIIPATPQGDEALAWWDHVRWLLLRPDFFELKRWPRDIRPGPVGGPEP